jgi:hypothetical protein
LKQCFIRKNLFPFETPQLKSMNIHRLEYVEIIFYTNDIHSKTHISVIGV